MTNQKKTCPDVINCLLADHQLLQQMMEHLKSDNLRIGQKRSVFRKFRGTFDAHTYGEEQSVIERGLQNESLRPLVLESLEEHEITRIEIERMERAPDDEQWHARLKVFCEQLEHHLKEEEEEVFPQMKKIFTPEQREELGARYLEARNKQRLGPLLELPVKAELFYNQTGRIGYVIAWILGVPAWLLLLVFLIRGH